MNIGLPAQKNLTSVFKTERNSGKQFPSSFSSSLSQKTLSPENKKSFKSEFSEMTTPAKRDEASVDFSPEELSRERIESRVVGESRFVNQDSPVTRLKADTQNSKTELSKVQQSSELTAESVLPTKTLRTDEVLNSPTFDSSVIFANVPMNQNIVPAQIVAENENTIVLQDFLEKMSDDLGISSEEIVVAFSKLSPEELMKPPEENLEKIINLLQIPQDQIPLAQVHFSQLLKKTEGLSSKEILLASNTQQPSEKLSQQQYEAAIAAASILGFRDHLSPQKVTTEKPMTAVQSQIGRYRSQIFKDGTDVELSSVSKWNGENQMKTSEFDMKTQSILSSPPKSAFDLSAAKLTPSELSTSISEGQVSESAGRFELPKGFEIQSRGSEFNSFNAALSPVSPEVSELETPVIESTSAFEIPNAESMGFKLSQSSNSSSDQSAWGDQSESEDSQSIEKTEINDVKSFQSELKPLDGLHNKKSVQSPLMVTDAQQSQNIQQVVSQAQFLAKKGGGEIKIEMAPEGVGKIKLKVAVENGQVQIEMLAENSETKKLLEKSLSDLKSSLVANNLKVDSLRIDTPSDVSKQFSQQYDQGQRQQAQQFMEQFRQENREWRGGMYDMASVRPYSSQRDEAQRRPLGAPAKTSLSSRRLDLVA